MAFIFDATMKEIVGLQTADFASFLHLPSADHVRFLNVDLSTLSAATDVAIGFGAALTEIVDLNFQAGPDSQLPDRGLLYSAALQFRYQVPVRSLCSFGPKPIIQSSPAHSLSEVEHAV